MAEPDLEKLLGGFSADTLTDEERQQLYAAALHNQQLFNALADEQALRELLADPVVRRRLLHTLAQDRSPGGGRAWLDRFTRPVGLAWAGGVAVGVFAVVLGFKVYQDSLRQAAETTASEEERNAPLKRADTENRDIASKTEPSTKDTVTEKSPDQAAASRPRERQDEKPKLNRKEESKKIDAPMASLGKAAEQPASDRRPAPSSPPAPELQVQALAPAGEPAAVGPTARALFHGQVRETDPGPKSKQLALRKTLDGTAPAKPLALRYSFVGSQEQERSGRITLTVESNQEAYVQVWKRTGDALPELVLPAKETGRISLKTGAGERQRIAIPPQTDQLIVRLSRVPFGPISRQEAAMGGRGSARQLTESVSGTEEQSTYVANPDLSASELAINIPLTAQTPR